MFSHYRVIWLVMLICVTGLLVSCQSEPPRVGKIQAQPSTTVLAGETASLTVEASGSDLKFEWAATRGILSDPTQPSVIYTAPDSSGADTVTVKVSSGGATTVQSITFQVIATIPIPTLTSIPTDTSVPTATDTIDETAPVPTATAVSRPPVCGLFEIFPQVRSCDAHTTFRGQDGKINDSVFVTQGVHAGTHSLKLTYENTAAEDYSGWYVDWSKSPEGYFNASSYSELVFWVIGESGGETFQIGLRDDDNEEKAKSALLVTVTQTWQQVSVPLSIFGGNVDLSRITRLIFDFTRAEGSGTIYIDDIKFIALTDTLPAEVTAVPPICGLFEIFPQVWNCYAYTTFRDQGGKINDFVLDTERVRAGTYSLKLEYSNTQELAYSGWYVDWSDSPDGYFKALSYSKLEFWVIGKSGGETFQIGLRDTNHNEAKDKSAPLVTVSAQTWQQVNVPLSIFRDRVDLSRITRLILVFTRAEGSGTIYIDDIAFVP